MALNVLGLEFGSAARLPKRPGSVWNCLWGNALKRSPGIIREGRVSYPGPGFLSSATWPSMAKKHYNGLNLNLNTVESHMFVCSCSMPLNAWTQGSSFSKHRKSVTMVTCFSRKFIQQNELLKSVSKCSIFCFSWREPIQVQCINLWVFGCYFSWSYRSLNFSCSANYHKN